jgi:hypothetical protein
MASPYADLQRKISIRPRVAFALAVAERVLPTLVHSKDAFDTAVKTLSDGWRWEEGRSISAEDLYRSNVEGLAVQGSLTSDPALGATISAYYYLMWHAFQQDIRESKLPAGKVPNDIAEVSEEVLTEVCEYAAKTPHFDKTWMASTVSRLIEDFSSDTPDDLGPSVMRKYFR